MFKQETHSCTDRPSACSTDATRMDNRDKNPQVPFNLKVPVVSVSVSVRNALDALCSRVVNLRGSQCVEIVESFLFCFLARKSGLQLMFTDLDYGRFIRSFEQTSLTLLKYQSDDCREQTFSKYWIDTYLAEVFLDDARPERPDWLVDNLFTGYLKRYINRRILHRDAAFIYSLAKGSKQMWPPLKEANVKASIRKSISRLTVPRNLVGIPDELCSCIQETSREIFREISSSPSNIGSKFMPSLSAGVNVSVKDGGIKSLFPTLEPPSPDLVKKLGKLRAADIVVNQWRQDTFNFAVSQSLERLHEAIPPDPDGIVGPVWNPSIFDTVYVPIFEPGKIRSISKCDGFLATTLQPLQGQMLDCWKHFRASTMLIDDLTDTVSTMDKELCDEEYFCSGDYEDATNLLFRQATVCAFEGVPKEHPLNLLAFLSLTSGSMYYPDPDSQWVNGKAKSFVKLGLFEGQLMGHTLSFPLLCVINFSVLKYSLLLWWRKATVRVERLDRIRRSRKILRYAKINGDDILFKGSRELIDIFITVASSVGFKISQGKNYVSRDMCMINSQMFRRVSGTMTRVGYLNLRLVKGMNVKSRKAAHEHPVNPTYIGKDLGKMARLTPWTASVIPIAMERFKQYTKTFNWFQPNWYLPVHLGGYGVPIELAPPGFKITRGQRLVAAMFVANPDLVLFRCSELYPNKRFKIVGVLNPVVLRGDTVLESHQVDISFDPDSRDPWLERLAYINFASTDSSNMNPDAGMMKMCTEIKHHCRLKPMTREKILNEYLTIRLVATKMPPCPPFHPIKSEMVW